MKNLFTCFLTFCFLTLFFVVFLIGFWGNKGFKFESGRVPEVFLLKPGETLNSLGTRLYAGGFIKNKNLFKILVKLKYSYKDFKAGQYLFLDGFSPNKIITMMLQGESYHELFLKIIVPEGFSLKNLVNRLVSEGYSKKAAQFLAQDKKFLKELGLKSSSLEGYLYPSTYHFYDKKPSLEKIYRTMVSKFFDELPLGYIKSLEEKNFSLNEGVIIASLIEKETSLLAEKKFIAEVILSRLKRKMTLGIDASLVYGIKNFSGDITEKNLRDRSNLYNTRVHRGLPPGPICSPSKSSLEAVLNPSDKGFLFYVLRPGGNKKNHHFSRSLSEHNKHVKNLIKKTR